jgi:hypothetical protein
MIVWVSLYRVMYTYIINKSSLFREWCVASFLKIYYVINMRLINALLSFLIIIAVKNVQNLHK